MTQNSALVCKNCEERLATLPEHIKLTNEEFALLNKPQRSFSVAIPVRMDNGSVQVFTGHRVQYNDALGPTKGGIRYHQEVDLEEVKLLAFLMSLKCSLAGLPYGGSKGGIEVDPSKLSKGELERLTRGYTRAIHNFIGPRLDIPAPDVNTSGQTMAWIVDEYSKIKGEFIPGVVTGKPIAIGGSCGREEATALGGFFVLESFIKEKLIKISGKPTVAIQGFGNVGGHIARILYERGFNVVAVSDASGGRYNKKGLKVSAICDDKSKGCRVVDEKEGEKISNEDLLQLPVDILIPAALGDVITEKNADKIRAKVILEMANAPVSKSADVILDKRKIYVIPDILANSGGVIVSYFEWVQNTSNEYWTLERVNEGLKIKITDAFNRMFKKSKNGKLPLRDGAYAEAISRILEAERLRGNIS